MNYAKIIYDLLSPEMAVPVAPMQMAQRQQPPYVVFNVDRITPQLYKGSPEAIDELEVTVMAFDIDLDAAQSNLATVRTALSAVNAPGLIQYSWPDFSGHQYLGDVKLYVAEQVFVLRIAHRAGAVTLAGALNLLASASVSINVPAFLQGGLALALGATGSITRTARLEAALSMNASTALTFSTTLAGDLLLNASADNILTVAKLLAGSIQLNATTTAAATISRLLAGDLALTGTGSAVVDVTSAGWIPSDLANIVAWYDASDTSTITESSGAVSQWDDKSGNANHISQSTGSLQPATNLNTFNSKNVINFDGDALAASSNLASNTLTIAFVSSISNANERIIDLRGTGASGTVQGVVVKAQQNISLLIDQGNNWYRVYGYSSTLSGYNVIVITINLTTSTVGYFVNGTDETTLYGDGGPFPTDIVNASANLTIGGNVEQNAQWLTDENICDVVFCDTDISTTDRQKLEGYLAHKWGLTASLPSGHPYKSSAP
jgi:hypothetical protein